LSNLALPCVARSGGLIRTRGRSRSHPWEHSDETMEPGFVVPRAAAAILVPGGRVALVVRDDSVGEFTHRDRLATQGTTLKRKNPGLRPGFVCDPAHFARRPASRRPNFAAESHAGQACNSLVPVGVNRCWFHPPCDWIKIRANRRMAGQTV